MSADVPGWNEPEYPQRPPPNRGAERVKAPAVFLIIVGIFNLLVACVLLLIGLMLKQMPADQFEREIRKQLSPEQQQAFEKAAVTPEQLQSTYTVVFTVLGTLEIIASVLIVFGAIRMLMLRSYGLAVLASLLAAVPFISSCACPFFVGIGIGIWSLVVLFNSDVRNAFR